MMLTRRAALASTLGFFAFGVAGAARGARTSPPSQRAAFGSFGIDLSARDLSVKPGDDFFAYVNGGWMAKTQIPPDRFRWGVIEMLREKVDKEIRQIVDDVSRTGGTPGSNAQKIADLYKAYLDQPAIEAKGLSPIELALAKIARLETHEQILRFAGRPDLGVSLPIDVIIDLNATDPDRYNPIVTLGGLGLPDRDYYLRDDEEYRTLRGQYAAVIAQMLRLVGQTDTDSKARAVLAFETEIARRHWPIADRRDRVRTYNPMDRTHLQALAPTFPWDARLEAAGLGQVQEVVVAELSAMTPLAELCMATPVSTWKSYLAWHYVRGCAELLPRAIDEANFAFFGKILTGQPQQAERWKRGIAHVNLVLGEAIGRFYVERHFSPEAKAQVLQMVENMRRAFVDRIEASTFLSPETKVAAKEKLRLFRPMVGYPDRWRDYSGLEIRPGDAFGNLQRYRIWEWNRNLARLGRPSDRGEWFATPQTVSAYYTPEFNEVVFPAGYLQPPLFDPNADIAVNYGAIGGVIGHEMGHALDDQGAKSDGRGVLRDWWTPDDVARFHAVTDRLVAQYDAFQPLPGLHVNGRLTLGENIGDNGGLQIALQAYRIALGGREAPVLEGTTGDQRFFMARAQGRRQLTREAALRKEVLSNEHAPAVYRVNGIVRNTDAWYAAFDVQPGDRLYLAPEDRVTVW